MKKERKPQQQAGTGLDSNKRLQIINERLRKSNEELKQFAYMASHDMKEPLRTISNYIDLFFRNYENTLTEEGKEYLQFAKDGAERMHRLVNDLLTYSRLDYEDTSKNTFNGNAMLENALQNLHVALEENDALIFYNDLPELYGNQNQVERLIQNLVDNAIKFKGEEKPTIFIDTTNKEENVEFSVNDNGIGIQKEFHEKIFRFFSRLNPIEKYTGSGLGLSICKKIVERHSGTISVESEAGRGSSFKFTLAKV